MRELKIHFHDSSLRCDVILGLERRTSYQELVRQDSKGPGVRCIIMWTSLTHLRGEVVESAT